jgi:hypothetical protein
MRVLQVSAHYPPNFVSGGTLQPQRLAQGLRDRGHDVSVYAGWLDSELAPLTTWTDTDETGMSVRWVVITPWIDWAGTENFENPAVTADLSATSTRSVPTSSISIRCSRWAPVCSPWPRGGPAWW